MGPKNLLLRYDFDRTLDMGTYHTERELNTWINEANKRAHPGRISRLQFLLKVEDDDLAPIDALASDYYEEARLCWYIGAFVATIVMSQLALEEMLRAHYRVFKGIKGRLDVGAGKLVDEATFANLIEQAKIDSWLSSQAAKALHKLRSENRNPYVHPKDIDINKNARKPDAFKQHIKIVAPDLLEVGVEDEARKSMTIAGALLRRISRRFWGM